MRSAIPVVEPAAVAYPTSTRVAFSIGRPCRRRTRVDEGPMTPEVGTEVDVRVRFTTTRFDRTLVS